MKRKTYIIIITIGIIAGILFFPGLVCAQDSIPPKKKEETPPVQIETPPAPATSSTPSNPTTPQAPPTPYIINGSIDNYAPSSQNYTYNKYKNYQDTVKPYIADATILEIIYWDNPAAGMDASAKDTLLFSLKPTITQKEAQNVIASLDTWKEETRVFSIPFQIDKVDKLRLGRFFNFPEEIKAGQKLYLYFEGISSRTELKLNGKFLGINSSPFKPWIVPLNTEWLRKEANLLELSLSYGEPAKYSPKQFLGIFRSVYILNQEQLDLLNKPIMESVAETKEKVAIFVPYYNEHRYIFDKFQAIRILTHAKKNGVKHIHFLLQPDRELKILCKQMGLIQVEKLKVGQTVCWLNSYPYEPSAFPFSEKFWLDQNGYRTPNYGYFTLFDVQNAGVEKRPVTILFAFLVFFPLLGIFLLKLLNPKFFYALPEILLKPRLQIERFIEAVAGNQGLSYILQFLRILMISITLALVVDYIHRNNQWHITGLAGDNALIKVLFIQKSTFLNYLLKSIILVSSWAAFRWLVIRTLSNLFNIYNMYDGLTNLELVASYPLILIINLPLVFLSFVSGGGGWHNVILSIQVLFIALYILRQVYVCFVGMGRLFKFSTSVKIIYIVLSVFLPYLITL